MDEYPVLVFEGAHEVDLAVGVALQEVLEELGEALDAVGNAAAVSDVDVAGVLGDNADIAIANAPQNTGFEPSRVESSYPEVRPSQWFTAGRWIEVTKGRDYPKYTRDLCAELVAA